MSTRRVNEIKDSRVGILSLREQHIKVFCFKSTWVRKSRVRFKTSGEISPIAIQTTATDELELGLQFELELG